MDSKYLDVVTVATLLVLVAAIGGSAYALYQGTIQFADYREVWAEPMALLLGFWLRGVRQPE